MLVVTSTFLELFFHITMTICSMIAFKMYELEPKVAFICIWISAWSDVGGYTFGKMYGKT